MFPKRCEIIKVRSPFNGVSTDCPSGPAEILEQGRYGPLVEVGDDEALAAFETLSRLEGIIPALETAHAVAYLLTMGEEYRNENLYGHLCAF